MTQEGRSGDNVYRGKEFCEWRKGSDWRDLKSDLWCWCWPRISFNSQGKTEPPHSSYCLHQLMLGHASMCCNMPADWAHCCSAFWQIDSEAAAGAGISAHVVDSSCPGPDVSAELTSACSSVTASWPSSCHSRPHVSAEWRGNQGNRGKFKPA